MATNTTISGDEPCAVHGRHIPRPYATDIHHVWPRGMGGPDVAENKIPVCSTGHQNIHAYLRLLQEHDGQVPTDLARKFQRGEIKYAVLGYERDKRGAL